jgi:hypothetical protein
MTDNNDKAVELSGDLPVPPQLQVTVLLPHDPDLESKLGRLITAVLAMGGRVVDVYPFRRPAVTPPITGQTPVVGEIVPDGAGVAGRSRRGSS